MVENLRFARMMVMFYETNFECEPMNKAYDQHKQSKEAEELSTQMGLD